MAIKIEKFEYRQIWEAIASENKLKQLKEVDLYNDVHNRGGITHTFQTFHYEAGDGYTLTVKINC